VNDEGIVPALEFAGLTKRFGENVAVDHIGLVVPPGSFFGLAGPNGVGKTTSLSMAVGLLRPDAGTVRIFGRDVWADLVAAKALATALHSPKLLVLDDPFEAVDPVSAATIRTILQRFVAASRARMPLRTSSARGPVAPKGCRGSRPDPDARRDHTAVHLG
jgi:ABC-type multidrug transport system ATPase subunit